MSLGRSFAGHSLLHKLDMAARYGFRGIEVFYEDLVDFAKLLARSPAASPQDQLAAAATIRAHCRSLDLAIVCLQPLMHYEGLVSREAHRERVRDAELWLELARALGTDLILIPSSFLPEREVAEDGDVAVADLREVADMGARRDPVVRVAYEALCWGTRVNTWEQSWDVVRRVDRSNFGICLDTFNIAGRVFADPSSTTGRTADADTATMHTLQRLVSAVDVSKVFLVQVADGERLAAPLTPSHAFYNPEQPSRMSWSRNARLFYGEERQGAYLPTRAILKAIVGALGFEGWLSFEVFNRRLTEADKDVPEEMARRAARAWGRMVAELGLKVEGVVEERMQAML
ncbi:hypothetical protein S40293_07383 [Stachybotrys chartarum IBT 40293]|nr:hypothetical protein S40293_07383 [Stachybotrys chartarum IBT 40293]